VKNDGDSGAAVSVVGCVSMLIDPSRARARGGKDRDRREGIKFSLCRG
jgi:hypothetical protein